MKSGDNALIRSKVWRITDTEMLNRVFDDALGMAGEGGAQFRPVRSQRQVLRSPEQGTTHGDGPVTHPAQSRPISPSVAA